MPHKTIVFVTGTGTDVGKTVVSAAIVGGLESQDKPYVYWKPIQTGGRDVDLQRVQEINRNPVSFEKSLYSFTPPVSPDQAALAVDSEISLGSIIEKCQEIETEYLVIEGAGGILVPFNEKGETWLDFLGHLKAHVVVVASSQLGTLNHTGLTLNALRVVEKSKTSVVLNGAKHAANEHSLNRDYGHLAEFVCFPEVDFKDSIQEEASQLVRSLNFQQSSKPVELDLKRAEQSIWRPFTQHKTSTTPLDIHRAKGVWFETTCGKKLMDGVSSWWTNTIGHGHPKIAEALSRQQQQLDHVLFADMVHFPAKNLVVKLSEYLDPKLQKYFFSDNGSTAVEVGLKMAYQGWQNNKQVDRRKFVALRGGYHGDTIGAMSVGKGSSYHDSFRKLLFDVETLKPVYASAAADEVDASLRAIKDNLEVHHSEIAAFIMEPMIQGAAGMKMISIRWQNALVKLFQSHKIPVIFDEIFTGFGRAGKMFAYEWLDVVPDIICLSKGLTGGTLALSLTVATEKIFQDFYHDDKAKAFLHGHSYTANPIACAVAAQSLDIYKEEGILDKVSLLSQKMRKLLPKVEKIPGVFNSRQLGGVLAFEYGEQSGDYFKKSPVDVMSVAMKHHLFLRPLGNTIYLCPPLNMQENEMDLVLDSFFNTVESLDGDS